MASKAVSGGCCISRRLDNHRLVRTRSDPGRSCFSRLGLLKLEVAINASSALLRPQLAPTTNLLCLAKTLGYG